MDGLISETCFASLDIGSHTTRMLLARKEGAELVPIRSERRVTRLARNFQGANEITDEAQESNLLALKDFIRMVNEFENTLIACGATGVVRRARNSRAVLDRIAAETGIECRILSEKTEALLSAKGILSVLPQCSEDLLTFDIGGGSVEFLLADSDEATPVWSASIPVGAATLTEAYLKADPPGDVGLDRAALRVKNEILSAKERMYATLSKADIIKDYEKPSLVGTAGTVTTLAAMYLKMERYVPYRVNGLSLSADWLSDTVKSLAQMSLAHRRLIPGLEPGREDIILGGAIIVSEILSCFGQDSFVVTDAGLLEGLLIDLAEKRSGLCRGATARLRTGLTWRL